MSTLTKAQSEKIILEAVKNILVDNMPENDILNGLGHKGIDYSFLANFSKVKLEIGLKKGWILSEAQIENAIIEGVKSNPVNHFMDVVTLAKSLKLGQLSDIEKREYIVKYCGVEASKIEESAQLKRLHNNSTKYGMIFDWIKNNPKFTPTELHNSGLIQDVKKREDFFEEFIANQVFFYDLYEQNNKLGIYKEVTGK